MTDHDIDPQLEHQLRSLLTEIADRFDPLTPEVSKRPSGTRRVPRAVAAALVAACIVGIAVVAARPSADDTTRGTATTAPHAGVSDTNAQIADKLLFPGHVDPDSVPEVSVVELSGAELALFQSPSGQLHRLSVNRIGASELDTGADRRVINDRTVVVEQDELDTYYQWIDQCVLGSLQTSTASRPAWNDEDLALLAAIDIDTDEVTLTLPTGWSVVNAGTANPLIQLVFEVEIRGTTRAVVLGQSIGGAITALPGQTGSITPTDAVPGRTAWIAQGFRSPVLLFDNDGIAVGLWGQDLTVDDLVGVAADLVQRPDQWNQLLTDPIDAAPPGTAAPGAAVELCGPPTLTIS
jgi:hypothetical protein